MEDAYSSLERQIKTALWTRGDLLYKCHKTQEKIYKSIRASPLREFFLLCSRRLGKSFLLVLLAFEEAVSRPNARILYLAPWAKDASDIATDAAAKLLEDCPEHLKPKYNPQVKEYHFPNGSIIRFKGTNGEHAQFLRGGEAHLVLVDEAGLMDDFRHVLDDVIRPMTLTTKGKIYIATTPARTPAHESFSVYQKLANAGAVFTFTLLDAPHIENSEKARMLEQNGERPEAIPEILAGTLHPETVTTRREYWCEWLTDASFAVVPEFTTSLARLVVKEFVLPEHFDAYVAMDPGIRDSTGILFGHWNFSDAKLFIEDEALLSRASAGTPNIARTIKERESGLWGFRVPFIRVSDIDARLIQDLFIEHGIAFSPAEKKDSLGAINHMRAMIQMQQIIIHPRCKHLVQQLQNATWNNKGTDFDRTELDSHFDLVSSLKYLTRALVKTHNPAPTLREYARAGVHFSAKRSRGKKSLGLLDDTPTGRKLAGVKK